MIISNINIGTIRIPLYGMCIVVGVFIANIIIKMTCEKKHFQWDDIVLSEAYFALGGIIGGKLLYLITTLSTIPWGQMDATIFHQLMAGGFVFYGALIGAIIAVFIGAKIHHLPILNIGKEYLYLIPFMHAFGRLGCHFAGCCYGVPYDGIFSVTYGKDAFAPQDVSLFPIQLLEAICLLGISGWLYMLPKYKNSLIHYLCLYAIIRFLLEFFRGDVARGSYLIFSTSQWISIIILIILLVTRRNKKMDNH